MERSTFNYQALPNTTGILKHNTTGKYLVRKRIKGKRFQRSFKNLRDARHWQRTFNGKDSVHSHDVNTSTLKEVWGEMQRSHFPLLAKSTQDIWKRRYILLKELENNPMELITSSIITSWVERQVKFYKSEDYEGSSRGKAKRCNLDNELNLFTTIFNWYRNNERFEIEASKLLNPVRTQHKRRGFIRAKSVKNKAIKLDDALKFFSYLKPLYRELALLQYYTASRISEVAGLQWSRVDFDSRKMTIMETSQWDMTTKMYVGLNPHPKNKEPRPVYITNEIEEVLRKLEKHKLPDNNFVFHVEGKPLNYGTIQLNYRGAQKKGNLPYSGTHILRHGMATLARKVGGGLDAVIAMTGHKDFKLADHYSKLDDEYQKEISEKIMEEVRKRRSPKQNFSNVIPFSRNAE